MSEQQAPEQHTDRFVLRAEHANGARVEVEVPGDTNLSDMADTIETFLIAAGYLPEQVRELFR
jgi:hypothetical protein